MQAFLDATRDWVNDHAHALVGAVAGPCCGRIDALREATAQLVTQCATAELTPAAVRTWQRRFEDVLDDHDIATGAELLTRCQIELTPAFDVDVLLDELIDQSQDERRSSTELLDMFEQVAATLPLDRDPVLALDVAEARARLRFLVLSRTWQHGEQADELTYTDRLWLAVATAAA